MLSGNGFKVGLFQIYHTTLFSMRKYYTVASASNSVLVMPALVHLPKTDQVVVGLTDASKWNISLGSGEGLEAVGALLTIMEDNNNSSPTILFRFFGIVKLLDNDIAVRWGKQRKLKVFTTNGTQFRPYFALKYNGANDAGQALGVMAIYASNTHHSYAYFAAGLDTASPQSFLINHDMRPSNTEQFEIRGVFITNRGRQILLGTVL